MTATKIIRFTGIVTDDTFEAIYTDAIGKAYVKVHKREFYDMYIGIKGADRMVEIMLDLANGESDSYNLDGYIHDFCKYNDVEYCEGINYDFLRFLKAKGIA